MKKQSAMFIKNLRYFCLLSVFAFGLMTIVSTGGGGGGDGGDGDGGANLGLSKSSANPAENLEVTGSGFNANALTFVVFEDAEGNETRVLASSVTSSSITVMVPPFFDVNQFQIISGTVSVSIIQELSSTPSFKAAGPILLRIRN